MGNSLLRAGRLDRRVTIRRAGASTRNSWGEQVPGASTETVRFAAVSPAPGTERFANAENAASAPMRFVLRWEPDLVEVTDSLLLDGRTFEIRSVTEIGRREGIEVLATARGE